MRKINFHPSQQIIVPEAPAPVSPPPVTTIIQTSPTQATIIQVRTRNGNGHTKDKCREITDSERAWLKNKFLCKNGQIEYDDCVTFKSQMVSDTIAIFQITGYVSVLHRYVALGRLELQNLEAYVTWMRDKYKDQQGRSIWTQYNNARFVTIRARRTAEVQSPVTEEIFDEPVFTTMSRRASYCKA
jgi:hypothetical protein